MNSAGQTKCIINDFVKFARNNGEEIPDSLLEEYFLSLETPVSVETPSEGRCIFMLTKGKSKGKECSKKSVKDRDYCKSHFEMMEDEKDKVATKKEDEKEVKPKKTLKKTKKEGVETPKKSSILKKLIEPNEEIQDEDLEIADEDEEIMDAVDYEEECIDETEATGEYEDEDEEKDEPVKRKKVEKPVVTIDDSELLELEEEL